MLSSYEAKNNILWALISGALAYALDQYFNIFISHLYVEIGLTITVFLLGYYYKIPMFLGVAFVMLKTFFGLIISPLTHNLFKEHLLAAIDRRDCIIPINLGCSLFDYQKMLKQLTENDKVKELEWTNIYSPSEMAESQNPIVNHREEFYRKKAKKKIIINIINTRNIKLWKDDLESGKVKEIKDKMNKSGEIKYVLENDLLNMESHKVKKNGDYALFNGRILVSFNPTSEDSKSGELWFTTWHIDGYPNIFKNTENYYEDLNQLFTDKKI
jgi:hypothetical protein